MILLSSHPDLHILNNMRLGGIEQFGLDIDANQAL
jgi:hypothetical protein